jgi:hypothetical protein
MLARYVEQHASVNAILANQHLDLIVAEEDLIKLKEVCSLLGITGR